MSKKEKIISIFFILSMILLVSSFIFTLYQNKPAGYSFNIEKIFKI